jgi:hypothetical protein
LEFSKEISPHTGCQESSLSLGKHFSLGFVVFIFFFATEIKSEEEERTLFRLDEIGDKKGSSALSDEINA